MQDEREINAAKLSTPWDAKLSDKEIYLFSLSPTVNRRLKVHQPKPDCRDLPLCLIFVSELCLLAPLLLLGPDVMAPGGGA